MQSCYGARYGASENCTNKFVYWDFFSIDNKFYSQQVHRLRFEGWVKEKLYS